MWSTVASMGDLQSTVAVATVAAWPLYRTVATGIVAKGGD